MASYYTTQKGNYASNGPMEIKAVGEFKIYKQYQTKQAGRTYIANDDAEGYAVYVGVDGPPDFTAEPDGFGAALPVDVVVTPPPSGTAELHVVVRKVNKYGLQSQNQQAQIITIDSSGDEELGPISAPEILAVVCAEGEYFRIFASYPGINTDANPADTFRFYVGEGAAPVAGTDTPVATGAAGEHGAVLVGPYATGGITYYFAVTVFRSADSLESSAAEETIELDDDPGTPQPLPGW